MDVWTKCRCPIALALGGVSLLMASSERLCAEPLVLTPSSTSSARFTVARTPAPRPSIPAGVRQLGETLSSAVQEATAELAEPLVLGVTLIGGHTPPVTPPPTPPTPPKNTSPPPPPPPTLTTIPNAPPPIPPPPTTQGGPPSSAPEPASIVTGLVGLTVAGAAGWYKRRKQR